MSKRRRRKSRSSSKNYAGEGRGKRTGLQTAIETAMGIGAALLVVGLCYWWFFVREPPEVNMVQENDINVGAVVGNVIDLSLIHI